MNRSSTPATIAQPIPGSARGGLARYTLGPPTPGAVITLHPDCVSPWMQEHRRQLRPSTWPAPHAHLAYCAHCYPIKLHIFRISRGLCFATIPLHPNCMPFYERRHRLRACIPFYQREIPDVPCNHCHEFTG